MSKPGPEAEGASCAQRGVRPQASDPRVTCTRHLDFFWISWILAPPAPMMSLTREVGTWISRSGSGSSSLSASSSASVLMAAAGPGRATGQASKQRIGGATGGVAGGQGQRQGAAAVLAWMGVRAFTVPAASADLNRVKG